VSELLQKLLTDSGYVQYVRESGELERLGNVTELMRSVTALEAEHGEQLSLTEYINDVPFDRDLEDDKDCVKIMTAHIAKGLEFHTVFIAGLSEKLFPSARALENRRYNTLEEERRLCYVAMTRAKKRLYMTESEGIGFRGFIKTPSRFLFNIDDRHILRAGGGISEEIMEEHAMQAAVLKLADRDVLSVGTAVRHKNFGEGVVESVDVNAKEYMIQFMVGVKPIRFDYYGLARLL